MNDESPGANLKNRQIIDKQQLTDANQILKGLRLAISPEFLGLISTSGHPISIYSAPTIVDTDAIGSLAASSYGATRLLAHMMNGTEFTVMFHEGSDLNVHIAQVSEQVLLVVCFSKTAEIGRVRLLSKKASAALNKVMTNQGEKSGTD
ncbi:MAG: roadblock/LC7 domain-containing protein [Thermoleophilia bacterium]